MRVNGGRALGRLPRVLGGLIGHVAKQIVMGKRRQEILHRLTEDRLVCRCDTAVKLDPPAKQKRAVRDLLHDGVLEPVTALSPLARRSLEDEVRRDELVHRVREPRATGLSEDTVAEALADHRSELDRFSRDRGQTVDAGRDDAMERRRHLERRGPFAELPLALFVPGDRPRLHERADRLLDEERVPPGARDDLVAKLVGDPVEGRVDDSRGLLVGERLEDELAEVCSDRPWLGRARTGALGQEQEDRDARGP